MKQKDVVIIGSGCAGYAAADRLLELGVDNILLLTEGKNCGTSRNTGSDKQTYYKAGLTWGDDSILAMARNLYEGGGIDAEQAMVEAVNSLRCFYRLEEYGINFPQGEFGEFIGYRTDHDNSERATSVGPFTSKKMTEVLEESALRRGLSVMDSAYAVKIAVGRQGVNGVVYLDLTTHKLCFIPAACIILAVGGSAGIYRDVVYPHSQHGSLSLALDAGCDLHNITEWQYGIASVGHRWNLSGSYQQVVPRYISIDKNGTEREFLTDYFENCAQAYEAVFLKGYEWPFDVAKIKGSSRVDLAVLTEIDKGRRVFLDYRRNPSGFSIHQLPIANQFWTDAKLKGRTPFQRLYCLNPEAVRLYKAQHIDLEKDLLEIAVCAQHCNGGVAVDHNFKTRIDGLFAIGEVSGNFGVYRPGGTALNSTQVGALRVSQYIRGHSSRFSQVQPDLSKQMLDTEERFLKTHISSTENATEIMSYFRERFSSYCGIKRDISRLLPLKQELSDYLNGKKSITIASRRQAALLYQCFDMLKTQYVMLESILYAGHTLGSRGGAVIMDSSGVVKGEPDALAYLVISNYKQITRRQRSPFQPKSYQFEQVLYQTNNES